jgi:hypothetical protein
VDNADPCPVVLLIRPPAGTEEDGPHRPGMLD